MSSSVHPGKAIHSPAMDDKRWKTAILTNKQNCTRFNKKFHMHQ